jgi:alpha-D-xyloside xylohydrolase
MPPLFPGIWRLTMGTPEVSTPVALRVPPPATEGLARMPAAARPFAEAAVTGTASPRGYLLELPLTADEQLYGLGLQLKSLNQRGKKKTLRVNSDPTVDLGDSHAPVPFLVSTRGWGVLIDTARATTWYLGSAVPQRDRPAVCAASARVALSTDELYGAQDPAAGSLFIEVPVAQGVELYLFAGPTLLAAVQRYNLFAGGGCLPARWGLGFWYRCRGDFDQAQVLALAEEFRREALPCDVLGLEPGWQTHTYSCTYEWSENFTAPAHFVEALTAQHYHLNLWEHAFVHPTAPLYPALRALAGDFAVWEGLVPDFTLPEARARFGAFHAREHLALGVSGYKLDECDHSDFIANPWSFPEISRFPSGLDGEQYHSLFGLTYQETLTAEFRARDQRTYGEVRSSGALAAPYPFVLYSDLYEHRDFIRGVATAGFSGLLWCPEVRHAGSAEELIRRLQSVICSPQALVNAWYIQHAPWQQWLTEANNAGQFAEEAPRVTAICRELLQLRMRLVPYLYAAFARYWQEGTPPFRALVMDYPDDPATWECDDQYLMGDRLLVAPVLAGVTARTLYLPAGPWVDFWTGERLAGGQRLVYAAPLERIPLFVRDHSLLPLATPTLHTADPASYALTVQVYGDGTDACTLFEDDGTTFAYTRGAYAWLTLAWAEGRGAMTRTGAGEGNVPRYTVATWEPR